MESGEYADKLSEIDSLARKYRRKAEALIDDIRVMNKQEETERTVHDVNQSDEGEGDEERGISYEAEPVDGRNTPSVNESEDGSQRDEPRALERASSNETPSVHGSERPGCSSPKETQTLLHKRTREESVGSITEPPVYKHARFE